MSLWRTVPTLRGAHVLLEPLAAEHVSALVDAARDGELWRLWYTSVPGPETAQAYVDAALAMHADGRALPFVVRDATGAIVGSTRYCNIDPVNQRVEIGYTWYAQRVQRTALNTEAKRLLLGYAFEQLQCIAVELRTSWFNQRSRAAIARLGAKQDGVLRNHMRHPEGGHRDTVVFSIIDTEWPAVRRHLDYRLTRGGEA